MLSADDLAHPTNRLGGVHICEKSKAAAWTTTVQGQKNKDTQF
jgi:hypothetical protein